AAGIWSTKPPMKAPSAKKPPRARIKKKKRRTGPRLSPAKRKADSKHKAIIPWETGGGTGFYNMPTAQRAQKVAGRCGACGAYYGYDGGCLC
ncbi:unnamed protein product, partial [marine sediment metagenome]